LNRSLREYVARDLTDQNRGNLPPISGPKRPELEPEVVENRPQLPEAHKRPSAPTTNTLKNRSPTTSPPQNRASLKDAPGSQHVVTVEDVASSDGIVPSSENVPSSGEAEITEIEFTDLLDSQLEEELSSLNSRKPPALKGKKVPKK